MTAQQAPPRPATDDSLHRRLRTALLSAGAAMGVMVLAAVTALVVVDQRIRDVTEVFYATITEADIGYRSIVDAEAAVRGYALTGDPATLVAYERLRAGDVVSSDAVDIDTESVLVDRLGADHPAVLARERAVQDVRVWFVEFAEPLVEQVAVEGPGSVTPEDVEVGQAAFDDFRADMEAYLSELRAEREVARADLGRWRTVLAVLVALLVAGAVAAGAVLWTVLRRWITEPLVDLAADARLVAGGAVDHAVRRHGPAEVGAVARDVELMRTRLAGLVSHATAAREEIERSHALLEDQAEDLRRSNRDLEQFAYVASHDLQEPLRKVASFTQLLAKRYEGQLDDRADQYIGFAVDGAKRMQRLINDLLSFSRVGRIGGEVTDVDVGELLAAVREDHADTIEETGATVTAVDLPVVPGESALLAQLLHNLLGNSLKFRHPDRAPEVVVTARRDGECWELAFTDNGIGIDPQYADRVFVIFQRLHAKDVYEGTGIGLALCKKIVEYHGGQIWIDSAPGEGTTIRWTVPVDPGTAPGTPDVGGRALDAATVGGGKDE